MNNHMKKTLPVVIVVTLALALITGALAKTPPKSIVKTIPKVTVVKRLGAGITPSLANVGAGLVLVSTTVSNIQSQQDALVDKLPLTLAQINTLKNNLHAVLSQNFALGVVVDPTLNQQINDAQAAVPASAKINGQAKRMITTQDVNDTKANIPIQ